MAAKKKKFITEKTKLPVMTGKQIAHFITAAHAGPAKPSTPVKRPESDFAKKGMRQLGTHTANSTSKQLQRNSKNWKHEAKGLKEDDHPKRKEHVASSVKTATHDATKARVRAAAAHGVKGAGMKAPSAKHTPAKHNALQRGKKGGTFYIANGHKVYAKK